MVPIQRQLSFSTSTEIVKITKAAAETEIKIFPEAGNPPTLNIQT